MFNTDDLITKTNGALLAVNYFNISSEEKPQVVEGALKYYTLSKINGIGTEFEDLSFEALLEKINKNLLKSEKKALFNAYIHFILQMINDIQHYEVIWEIGQSEALINQPLATFNNEGLLDKLVTHEKTESLATLLFILDIFKNHLSYFRNNNQERFR